MKYRKKPVVVEAMQWTGLNLEEVKDFVGEALTYDILDIAWEVGKGRPHVFMKIKTLEGDMEVSEKDYIIKGVNGEFYPCKPDIFQKTYAPENTEDKPIGRLINADTLIEEMKKWYWDEEKQKAADNDINPMDLFTNLAIETVNAQPTAYDLVSVITELSALKTMYFLTIANTGDEKLDLAYEKVENALDKAIEIVKGCGLDAEN